MSLRVRVGVLASGAGTNLRALCAAARQPDFPAEIVQVISNRRDAGAVSVATGAGIPVAVMPLRDFGQDARRRDRGMAALFLKARVDLVVCAGYNRILDEDFLSAFPNAILNVHPSLLPAFPGGMNAVDDALAAGVTSTGCTVHLLTPGDVDSGPVVLQEPVPPRGASCPRPCRSGHREEFEWTAAGCTFSSHRRRRNHDSAGFARSS